MEPTDAKRWFSSSLRFFFVDKYIFASTADTERPSVKLTTYETRTTEPNIPVLIKFIKPVFDFNSSAIMIWGGQLLRQGISILTT
jgi:hypothetical protein